MNIAIIELNMIQKGFSYTELQDMDLNTFEIFSQFVQSIIEKEAAEMNTIGK